MRNAISPAFLDSPEANLWFTRKQGPVLAYTSTPFRGLDILLTAFPSIRKAVPDARLRVYSSMALHRTEAEGIFAPLYELCRALPGTEYSVPLAQTQLARAMANVDVLAYPSIFPETSCIAVMEAMASNTLVITTKIGALEETTAGFGFLLDLNADRYVLIRDYAALVVRVITQANSNREATLERLSSQRRYAIENYSWAARARQWFEWLAGVAGGRS